MFNANLTVLSYHNFTAEDSDYPFSRTYKQFQHDLNTKDFDWITIDDGHESIIKACKMMEEKNFRAKLFISTALIGTSGYCTWDQLWHLSRVHDIENHSHEHVKLTELDVDVMHNQISMANDLIKQFTGRKPRYFVPPWNQRNGIIEAAAHALGLQLVHSRTDIKNDSR
jgi:peptidoglycan/xylan/chitin deacetylase (PgdA/CDA1 family)